MRSPVTMLGLVVVVIAAIAVLLAIVAVLGPLRSFRLGQVTLTCPHCGEQTHTTGGKCMKCGKEL